MSQTVATAPRADIRTASRWFAALILPIGPAAVALLRYFLPYDTVDDPATITSKLMADPGGTSLMLWLGFIATLTLVPGAYFVSRLIRTRVPWLTAISLILVVPGYLVLPWMASGDAFIWSAGQAGLDAASITKAAEVPHGSVSLAAVVFVVGHVLGTILLGVALWRSRMVPRWAAIATAISQPIHIIAAVVVVSHTLDLVGWGLQAAGFAAVGWAILRLRDHGWDPLP
ncbi:hypothetical protein GCM10029976_093280 [Kribbella albertanoniae]|uniref:hypothetical protein n=1 Tax=Kribbella albertanoniae TaxID=1266829 RepID=UPI00140467FC|nr:hypothetical protein [Kribbella albertanoniae]